MLASRSPVLMRLMTAYMRRYARRHFHALRLARGTLPNPEPERAIIVYCNHPSWWDPVMCIVLHNHAFPLRSGFGPIDQRALERYGILRRIGLFGLDTETPRGAARFLRVGAGILRTPGTVLWVTAEGGFTDPRQRPVRLRPGVAHLVRLMPDVLAIPLAMEFPFWNESAPEALLRFGEPVRIEPGTSVAECNDVLSRRLTDSMDLLALDAITRDPSRFDNLAAGRAGIGGIYDLWRRTMAALRGERARLTHGDITR